MSVTRTLEHHPVRVLRPRDIGQMTLTSPPAPYLISTHLQDKALSLDKQLSSQVSPEQFSASVDKASVFLNPLGTTDLFENLMKALGLSPGKCTHTHSHTLHAISGIYRLPKFHATFSDPRLGGPAGDGGEKDLSGL